LVSGPENFLERWSRLKREAVDNTVPVAGDSKIDQPASAVPAAPDPSRADVQKEDGTVFDVSKLPPLESIGANSDVRAFMQPGIPSELKHAALRRAWSADTEIRDFIGLVENGWDFNDPDGVPGFGPRPQDEDVPKLLAQALGAPGPDAATATESPQASDSSSASDVAVSQPDAYSAKDGARTPGGSQSDTSASALLEIESNFATQDTTTQDIATQKESTVESSGARERRRGHGGALPI
jgi:hypothetical protein